MPFKFYKQPDQMDCGPACIKMVAQYYGKSIGIQHLRDICQISREGVSMLGLSEAADKIGLYSEGIKVDLNGLKEVPLPCILYWSEKHFVTLVKRTKKKFVIADPSVGILKLTKEQIKVKWYLTSGEEAGIALILQPNENFWDTNAIRHTKVSWMYLFRYLSAYKSLILQLLVGFMIAVTLQLVVPFLTKSIVDVGIGAKSINFVTLIVLAQGVLIIGKVTLEFIRSWILLHISTRLNIGILSDFLIKLMKLPISFFDTKMTGDIIQRMSDEKEIENFITGPALGTMFSFFSLLVISSVLLFFDYEIFAIYIICTLLHFLWISVFLKRRRHLNYQAFNVNSKNQSRLIQLVLGMQDIKLNNCENEMRWDWERLQAKTFYFNIKSLILNQFQHGGATFLLEAANLFITYLSAKSVINGELTVGSMLAIQYLIGQLNQPVQQLLIFIQGFQDAKISMSRLNEIHQLDDEQSHASEHLLDLPTDKSIALCNVSFRYPGAGSSAILDDLSINIPQGKTTAIVGMSGSGKTTLLKLLLRFYEPQKGEITVGNHFLSTLGFQSWRQNCGAVMQDGFIFSESIEKNIAVGEANPDQDRLRDAIEVANIQDYISSLPQGLQTKIGAEGSGVSQGQRQRILIARSVYKNPHYIFFDEATNALDANNEALIMNNLHKFFLNRTVVVVAHRLSTVRTADNIVCLANGRVVEQGTHDDLVALDGYYYNLVKNQLRLSS